MLTIILYAVILIVGMTLGWLSRWLYGKFQLTQAEQRAERVLHDMERDAEARKKEIILDARSDLLRVRQEQEKRLERKAADVQRAEEQAKEREKIAVKAQREYEKKEARLAEKEGKLAERFQAADDERVRLVEELEKISGYTRDEAKKTIISSMEAEALKDAQVIVKKIEQDATDTAQREARRIVVSAIQRIVPEVNSDLIQSTVHLPNEDMKGRIIGKDGRNIRSIETVSGADIVIDDTHEAVTVSCFDPVRREIARRGLEILIRDGRIHPARIEETMDMVAKEIDEMIVEKGEQTLYELGIHHFDPELKVAIGRLYFRSSYGQNVLMHSKEVAVLAGMIAAEIGADRDIAKRGGILHDVGKGIESTGDSSHVELGVEFAQRIRESDEVVNAIAAHHGDVPYSCIESVIVQVADSISASRPGARRESTEHYIERLRNLESIAEEFDGVEKAFAIQAGRELRVLVNHEEISDEDARSTARYIAKNIEKSMQYPGRIKITLIRENRITEYAR